MQFAPHRRKLMAVVRRAGTLSADPRTAALAPALASSMAKLGALRGEVSLTRVGNSKHAAAVSLPAAKRPVQQGAGGAAIEGALPGGGALARAGTSPGCYNHSDTTLYISSVILHTKYTGWCDNDFPRL
jgi:hypothetical protein